MILVPGVVGRLAPVAASLILGAGLVGCARESRAGGELKVTATTTQVGEFVRAIGGRRIDLTQILESNSDPHDYEPRPSDVRSISQARVVFRSGGELDAWLEDLIDSAGGDAPVVDLGKAARAAGTREADPHWWHDPRNAARAVAAVRTALAEADPQGSAGYERNAAGYLARLRRLDRSVARCIGKLPPRGRKLVTTHDALGHFARRYGLEVVGALIPARSTEAQPSAKDIDGLVEQIERLGVRAIFPESSVNAKLERAVSRETGARVGGALWADTLGPPGSSGATYIGSVRANTREIVRGLTGGAVSCSPRGR